MGWYATRGDARSGGAGGGLFRQQNPVAVVIAATGAPAALVAAGEHDAIANRPARGAVAELRGECV